MKLFGSSRRGQRSQGAVLVAFVAASLAAHAVIVATTTVHLGGGARDGVSVRLAVIDPADDLQFSCAADVGLVTGARIGLCATPFAGQPRSESCADDAISDATLELISCLSPVLPDSAESVALVDWDAFKPAPLLDVKPIDDLEAAQLLEEETQKKLEEAEKEISNPAPNAQVVEITRPNVEMRPDKARFVSEYDSRVEKEMVARGSTEEMVERPAPKELPVADNPPPLPEDPEPTRPEAEEPTSDGQDSAPGASEQGDSSGLLAMRGKSSTDRAAEEALVRGSEEGSKIAGESGLADRWGNADSDRDAVVGEDGGGSQAGGGPKAQPDLRPSEELLARAVGGGSVDKVDDVESGEFTALNSKKWKYASFFNRLKRQVAQNWHPDQVYLRRDPTGKTYGSKDRLTVLRVSLNRNGSLAKVIISKQSGIDFLDDEAIRAFELAQPFPNPPGGLVDDGSQLITFSFGFHFQIGSSAGSWKVFRYR